MPKALVIEYPGKKYSAKYVPTIQALMESNAPYRIIIGPWGSGKSVGCIMELFKRSSEQKPDAKGVRKTRWALVRNTYKELSSTTQKSFFEWFEPGIHGDHKVAEKTFVINRPLPDGSQLLAEFMFLALDDPQDRKKLLSLELTGVWFNELKQISEIIFNDSFGRTGRYPKMEDGGATWRGIIADSNPPDTDHWLYRLLEKDSHLYPDGHEKAGELFLEHFRQPSGLNKHPDGIKAIPIKGVHAENLPNLERNYYEDLCLKNTEDFIKVNVRAEYGYVREGKPVYGNWDSEVHVSKQPIEIVRAYPIVLGWDFGSDFSACLIAQQLPSGVVNIKKEFIGEYTGLRQFVNERVKPYIVGNYLGMEILGTGDLTGKAMDRASGSDCFQELIDAGLPAEPCVTNDPIARFDAVNSLLIKRLPGNKGALQVDPSCEKLIRGFEGEYKYKRIYDARHQRYGDKPDKNEFSHVHDALQYGALFLERGIQYYRRQRTVTSVQKPLSVGAWT